MEITYNKSPAILKIQHFEKFWKYNISSSTKNALILFAENLKFITRNKDFFSTELEKNIYLYDKKHLINLNILNYVIDNRIKRKDFFENVKRILQSKKHEFSIDGKYLMKNGMKQGVLIGKVLKIIEKEWLKNNFKITKERVQEIIKINSN